VDGALLLPREQTQIGHARKLAGAPRQVRQIPEVRLEEQAFVDGLDPGQAALRESPAPSGRPMQARSPPVPELQRARNDGRQHVAAVDQGLGLETDFHAGARVRSCDSFSTILPTRASVSWPTSRNSMPIPGSSTPGPLAFAQATRPLSLHSLWPGSWRSTLTRVPIFGVWCEFTNTPPTERFVPQPLKVPSSDET